MVEINLLPWRSELRQRKNKIIRNSVIFFAALIVVIYVVIQVQHLFLKNTKKYIKTNVLPPVMKYHYIGYVQKNQDFLALIKLPNGETMDVRAGSALGEKYGRVVSVNEKEIIIKMTDQTVGFVCAVKLFSLFLILWYDQASFAQERTVTLDCKMLHWCAAHHG